MTDATETRAQTPLEDHSVRGPVPVVGVVAVDAAGRVAMIRRGTPPRLGEWSIPGGRIEWGETAAAAALRELREETGLDAELVGLIDVVDGLFASRTTGATVRHYVMVDFAARVTGGSITAGDDAAEARFMDAAEIEALPLWDETRRVIAAGLARLSASERATAG